MTHSPFDLWAQTQRTHFESVADTALPAKTGALGVLQEAIRYAVLDGGKRVRALLVYAAGTVTGAKAGDLDMAALAVEMVHGYSLVHDDMPCMDNDLLRRGKPTSHVKYGQAVAMLSGDALQPEAFECLLRTTISDHQKLQLVACLAKASGAQGMCGGQAIDLLSVGQRLDLDALRQMHAMKTGALIEASVLMGAICGEPHIYESVREPLLRYAQHLGLGFQVVDDILDVTATTEMLGKTAGKDEDNDKPTYVSLLGLEQARVVAQQCSQGALQALEAITETTGDKACVERLAQVAHYVIDRTY